MVWFENVFSRFMIPCSALKDSSINTSGSGIPRQDLCWTVRFITSLFDLGNELKSHLPMQVAVLPALNGWGNSRAGFRSIRWWQRLWFMCHLSFPAISKHLSLQAHHHLQEASAHSKHASRLNPTCYLQVQPLKETTHRCNKATELCPTGCVPVTRNQVFFEHFCLAFQCHFQSVLLLQLLKKEILQLRWRGAHSTVQTRT